VPLGSRRRQNQHGGYHVFRFSIRDMLWLTLVVAMGLGWFVRERQLQVALHESEVTYESKCGRLDTVAKTWKSRTGALEALFDDMGHVVVWDLEKSEVKAKRRSDTFFFHVVPTTGFEPSIKKE
jgi:hypothetical protein